MQLFSAYTTFQIYFCPQKVEKTILKSCSEKVKSTFLHLLQAQLKWPKQKNSCSKMWPIDQLYIELGFYLFASGPVVKAKFFSSKLLFSWTSFLPGGFLWAFSGQLGTNLGSLQVPKKRPERLKEDGKKLIHEKIYFLENNWLHTPARTLSISGLKSRVFKL